MPNRLNYLHFNLVSDNFYIFPVFVKYIKVTIQQESLKTSINIAKIPQFNHVLKLLGHNITLLILV